MIITSFFFNRGNFFLMKQITLLKVIDQITVHMVALDCVLKSIKKIQTFIFLQIWGIKFNVHNFWLVQS